MRNVLIMVDKNSRSQLPCGNILTLGKSMRTHKISKTPEAPESQVDVHPSTCAFPAECPCAWVVCRRAAR